MSLTITLPISLKQTNKRWHMMKSLERKHSVQYVLSTWNNDFVHFTNAVLKEFFPKRHTETHTITSIGRNTTKNSIIYKRVRNVQH